MTGRRTGGPAQRLQDRTLAAFALRSVHKCLHEELYVVARVFWSSSHSPWESCLPLSSSACDVAIEHKKRRCRFSLAASPDLKHKIPLRPQTRPRIHADTIRRLFLTRRMDTSHFVWANAIKSRRPPVKPNCASLAGSIESSCIF